MSALKDARQAPRFTVDLHVSVSIDDRQLTARTRDISRTGICLISERDIPLDTELQIELVLAFATGGLSEPLAIFGRAVWCTRLYDAFQVGVKFVQVDAERARHLDMFIGLMDGSLAAEQPLDDDEETDKRSDPDDPFQI
jgi:c-di-GMP-binding flagellar brake protein YcgR